MAFRLSRMRQVERSHHWTGGEEGGYIPVRAVVLSLLLVNRFCEPPQIGEARDGGGKELQGRRLTIG